MLSSIVKTIMGHSPDKIAFAITSLLASLPQRSKLTTADKNALRQATRLEYGQTVKKVAWSWGKGPLVICVHGWGGRGAADMVPLAMHLAKQGFRAVAIDMTAHGSSKGRRISFRVFCEDIAEFSATLEGNVFAYLGYSAGGLSMMAARKLEGISAKNYVCIAAPKQPYPPLNVIRQKLGVSDKVLSRYQNFLCQQFECPWDEITGQAYCQDKTGKLLLIYDESDRFVSHSDGDTIKDTWPGAKLVKTAKYSHSKIMASPEVRDEVAAFLKTQMVGYIAA